MNHPAFFSDDALLAECEMRRLRRSGPGGQHRNKVETAVVLCHRSSGVTAEANERRSQGENRKVALFRLRIRLALKVRSARQREELPSPLWKSRRTSSGQLSISATHHDFPVLLVDALDAWEVSGRDLARTAEILGVTTSQWVKFLGKEPQALVQVNADRENRGLKRLH